jgi:hypothetical protein
MFEVEDGWIQEAYIFLLGKCSSLIESMNKQFLLYNTRLSLYPSESLWIFITIMNN